MLTNMLLLFAAGSGQGSYVGSSDGGFWFPPAAATAAESSDETFNLLLSVSCGVLLILVAVVLFFLFRYRRSAATPAAASDTENIPLQALWTVIPAVLVVALFFSGFKDFVEQKVVPGDAYEIRVKAKQWAFEFTYPEGAVVNELHLPSHRPISLVLESEDVGHSLFIPAFRLNQEIVPGRETRAWVEAVRPGSYDVMCSEYCGGNHSTQRTLAVVQTAPEFDNWLRKASNPYDGMTPEEAGKAARTINGCNACHTVDGSNLIGPSWKGLFGTIRKTDKGEFLADEAYIRESILTPNARVSDGYQPIMTPYEGRISEDEIKFITAYMKTLESE